MPDPIHSEATFAERHGFRAMRIKRLRRTRWFWFKLNVGFGTKGWYVERY